MATITYRGDLPGAHELLAELESIGCRGIYDLPGEQHDGETGEEVAPLVVTVTTQASEDLDVVRALVKRFVARHPAVEIDLVEGDSMVGG